LFLGSCVYYCYENSSFGNAGNCCMFVVINYIQKNSFDVGTVKNKSLLSVRTARKLCQVCWN